MKTVDLGMSYDGMKMPMKSKEEHWPTMTYDGPKDLELPEEGVMKVRYKKTRSSESKMGDHTMYSCTVEIRQILDVKSEKAEAEDEAPTRKFSGAEDALDELMAAKLKERRDDY